MEEQRTSAGEMRRVMFAIDESEGSLYALEWALKNLQETIVNSQVLIFTAQPKSEYSYIFSARELRKDIEEQQRKTAASLLEKATDICNNYGITAEAITEVGDPKDAIRDAVEKQNVQLLIVGKHGQGGLKRAFLGSVSNYCVHNVKCPVLLVK